MIQNILNKPFSDITEDDLHNLRQHISTLEQQLDTIKRILTADTYVEEIYEMLVQYLGLYDFEKDLKEFKGEND